MENSYDSHPYVVVSLVPGTVVRGRGYFPRKVVMNMKDEAPITERTPGDAQCPECGRMFWFGEGPPTHPLCVVCYLRSRDVAPVTERTPAWRCESCPVQGRCFRCGMVWNKTPENSLRFLSPLDAAPLLGKGKP